MTQTHQHLSISSLSFRALAASLAVSTLNVLMIGCGTAAEPIESKTQGWSSSVSAGQAEAQKIRNMSLEDEYRYGAELDAALKDPARAKETGITITTLKNHPAVFYVESIGQRLAAASTRPEIRFTFQVVQEKSVNAFATMGGYVYVHSGLLKSAANEAQVAGVLAHEISHIVHKHALRSMADQAALNGWVQGVGGLGGMVVSLGSAVLFRLPSSRSFEFEADNSGLDTMRRAGYASEQMIAFFRNVLARGEQNDGRRRDWLSTHPDTSRRIDSLQRRIGPADQSGLGLNDAQHAQLIQSL
jgi:predicted Zn-dependent protease